MDEKLSASGGFVPSSPSSPTGALPLHPAGGYTPDPRYRLALRALAMVRRSAPLPWQILDKLLFLASGEQGAPTRLGALLTIEVFNCLSRCVWSDDAARSLYMEQVPAVSRSVSSARVLCVPGMAQVLDSNSCSACSIAHLRCSLTFSTANYVVVNGCN